MKGKTSVAKTAIQSVRDPEVEELLTKRGVTWKYVENVAPSAFDPVASINNNSRLGKLDEPTAARYTEALSTGRGLPAVVARRGDNGLYVIVSGNHRLAAYTRRNLLLNVYEVTDVSKRTVLELTFVLNLGHGLPPPEEERLRQALHLVENQMSQTAAAALMLVPLSTLEKEVRRQEAKRRASAAGLTDREWEKLPASTRQRLGGVHTDEGFRELARLTVDGGLTSDEVQDVIATINVSRSGDTQRSLVQDLREQVYKGRIESGGAAYKPTPGKRHTARTNLERAVTSVLHITDYAGVASHYPTTDREEIVERIDAAVNTLQKIRSELSAPGVVHA
jgi:hypothetical protein